ncbi:MAG: hypothetical protein U1E02_02705, partial [Hydrogenophaga sp.]|nr:hypothetical protein [Hydrogenophaga sp.]
MLDDTLIQQLAAELQHAQQTRTPVEHFSKRHPGMTVEDFSAFGHKIGLTSRAMQISSQIDEPDYGTLLDSMLFTAKAGEVLEIPMQNFIAPRVEVELAFVLKAPLAGPNVTVDDVLNATAYITPAIEIIDARIEQFDRHTRAMRKVFDTISDNAANAGIVIGSGDPAFQADPHTTNRPGSVDWARLDCRHPKTEKSPE